MKLKLASSICVSAVVIGSTGSAQSFRPADCDEMTSWNYSTAMCEGRAVPGMPMSMLMVHGNAFAVGDLEEGPRGQNKVAAPNMLMADIGTSISDRNYLNLDVMLTLERWVYPESGVPLLLQIGEENQNGQPYLDSQHPHSSPLMGLTLSDSYSIGNDGRSHFKVFAAPRGEATEGPTAFMHRLSGLVNPDAPLGHHIGQDVGHIASTVLGAELRLRSFNLETSTFYGAEPEPSKVDLPVSTPNSYALRVAYQISPELHAMASAAFVKSPETQDPHLDHVWRYSASIYTDAKFENGWIFHDAFVYGLINFYDHAGALTSLLYEAVFAKNSQTFWGRAEAVERTPDELAIVKSSDRTTGRYVELLTLGFTHVIRKFDSTQIQLGASVTKDFLPTDYQADYGGNPLSAKVFLQFGGMQMWTL